MRTEEIIKAACEAEFLNLMAEYNANNGTYLAKLINEHGVKLRKFNDDVYDAFGEAAEAVFETAQAHSPLAKKIHDDYLASFSAAGPTYEGFVKPDLVAPGGHVYGLMSSQMMLPPGLSPVVTSTHSGKATFALQSSESGAV